MVIIGCDDSTESTQTSAAQKFMVEGQTMGTTYNVTYYAEVDLKIKVRIDSLLSIINQSLSTYIKSSVISIINRADSTAPINKHFIEVYKEAHRISEITNGSFDYTVMPLVNAWGFGFNNKEELDSAKVDSILKFVGYKLVDISCETDSVNCILTKSYGSTMIDFSAIAKGYAVDLVSKLLENAGIGNWLVEIGGEVRASGNKADGKPWNVGIDKPNENVQGSRTKTIITISDMSMATSGNYRNYYIEDGIKYAHTIDPKSGYPSKNELLSATVFSKSCMTADAFATSFMVMGVEKSLQIANALDDIETYLIYRGEDNKLLTIYSKNFPGQVKLLKEFK